MKITVYDYLFDKKATFKNDAKGIRDFIHLLNKMFVKNGIKIQISFTYGKDEKNA